MPKSLNPSSPATALAVVMLVASAQGQLLGPLLLICRLV